MKSMVAFSDAPVCFHFLDGLCRHKVVSTPRALWFILFEAVSRDSTRSWMRRNQGRLKACTDLKANKPHDNGSPCNDQERGLFCLHHPCSSIRLIITCAVILSLPSLLAALPSTSTCSLGVSI